MMSAEHKELLRLHHLLTGQHQHQQQQEGQNPIDASTSDLSLLRTVVSLLKRSSQVSSANKLDESLAFDSDTRGKLLDADVRLEAQDKIWRPLEKFDDQLRRDYTCRRQMLLSRLDCTIESFKWKGSNNTEPKGGKAKSMNEQIHETYDKARLAMKDEPQVSMAYLLAVRETDCDRLLNGVVSSSSGANCKIQYGDKGTKGELVNLKQVIIPKVPDRGGRTDEVRPPPKETFGQQRGRGVGGGGGFGRHSKHQAGHRGSGERRR
uniref:Protein FAM98B n=1 Tax=Aceria tosichella TaxID=561515 RepID=A0A6G1S3Q9_9ACAR